jgi:hypothetical protein
MPASPGAPPPPTSATPSTPLQSGQGTAGVTDMVTQLQGIVKQLSNGYMNGQSLISALQAINFPQNLKGYTIGTLPASPSIGQMAYVTDAASGLSWGAAIGAGGHGTTYLVWNGPSGWTVVGK